MIKKDYNYRCNLKTIKIIIMEQVHKKLINVVYKIIKEF